MAHLSPLFPLAQARGVLAGCMAMLTCLFLATTVEAQAEEDRQAVDDLMMALQIDDLLTVMRVEGVAYGEELAQDMLPGGITPRWLSLLDEIYDTEKMRSVVLGGFDNVIEDSDTGPLIDFFSTDLGQRIVQLELSARRAMIDDRVEEAARETYRIRKDAGDARLDQISRFIEVNDLLEENVVGALNASLRFYTGIVDGGGMAIGEADILSDVWSQEEETRDDTRGWLYGFLLLAYEPLTDAELETYIALSVSPEGRALNRALFRGFNAMYDEISYALGLAAARQMQQQDL
jgi:hypothetical protein